MLSTSVVLWPVGQRASSWFQGKASNYAIKRDLRRNTGFEPSFQGVGPLFWLLDALSKTNAISKMVLAVVLVSTVATASQHPIKETALPKGYCIELNGRGFSGNVQNLVGLALSDSEPGIRLGRSSSLSKLRFYKAALAHDKQKLHLIFFIGGWSDIYKVYTSDSTRTKLESKTTYGSLHYSCTAANHAQGV